MLYTKLICHIIGISVKWIFYLGKKSIDEIAKDDNSGLGLAILIFFILILYSYK